jgi:HK97 gp10 family phage protein
MARIRGSREHSRRLQRMQGAGPERLIGQALFVGGEMIQVEAQLSITRGAVSGKAHVPSKPGEPPKADTHRLADNIETVQVVPLKVEVSSNAPYSVPLEYGTSKMAARPFMKPATEKKRAEVVNLVRGAIRKVVEQSGA